MSRENLETFYIETADEWKFFRKYLVGGTARYNCKIIYNNGEMSREKSGKAYNTREIKQNISRYSTCK